MRWCPSLCLPRFLYNLAAACCTGGNPGVCVWAHVNEYQHVSVSLRASLCLRNSLKLPLPALRLLLDLFFPPITHYRGFSSAAHHVGVEQHCMPLQVPGVGTENDQLRCLRNTIGVSWTAKSNYKSGRGMLKVITGKGGGCGQNLDKKSPNKLGSGLTLFSHNHGNKWHCPVIVLSLWFHVKESLLRSS